MVIFSSWYLVEMSDSAVVWKVLDMCKGASLLCYSHEIWQVLLAVQDMLTLPEQLMSLQTFRGNSFAYLIYFSCVTSCFPYLKFMCVIFFILFVYADCLCFIYSHLGHVFGFYFTYLNHPGNADTSVSFVDILIEYFLTFGNVKS